MKISTNVAKTISLKGKDGTVVTVDVSKLKLSADQDAALHKLGAAGSLDDLSKEERDLLQDVKARIGSANDPQAFVCRFDLTWVRID